MSMSTRSGWCSTASLMPSAAVMASSVRNPRCRRTSRASLRFLSLSSTMRMSSPATSISSSRHWCPAAAPHQLHEFRPGEAPFFRQVGDTGVEPLPVSVTDDLRSEHDDGDVCGPWVGPQLLDHLETVGARHEQVKNDQGRVLAEGDADALIAALGAQHAVTLRVENRTDELESDRV